MRSGVRCRVGSVFVAALGCALVLTGCSSGQKSGNLDGVAVSEEFSREAASLSWPDGFPIPSPRYQEMDHPTVPGRSPGRAQPGVGMSDADSAWFCAWEEYYLADPSTNAERAVENMRKLRGLHVYQAAGNDGTRAFYDNIINSAELGDAGLVQRSVQGCSS
ncbi:hypothetical protein MAJHIDBO_00444 [Propionibacterium freudenreichii subsp. shermanii]|nr:hypothetical protein MAJHIDBO_00444 [Propionibacterium freudenreichii subsp. shermanii]SPS08262.1 hypothetical protein MAJHIDBO_00444 [Propionibacterium freudenreichii subsp. shermanii]